MNAVRGLALTVCAWLTGNAPLHAQMVEGAVITDRIRPTTSPLGGFGPVGPADLSPLTRKDAPGPQTYRWEEQPDTKLRVLYRGQDRIGQYDMTQDVYRRVNTDGTLSNPAPRPWRTHPGVVPAPSQVLAKVAVAKAALDQETPAAAMAQGNDPVERVLAATPRWLLYTAGGGLAGLALLCGLMAHGRRR